MTKFIHLAFSVALVLLVTAECSSQRSEFVNVDQTFSMHYRIFGKGEPLLIINGGPGMNSNGFESLAMKLSENFQTIIYDQRGTGKSVLPKVDTSTITMQLMIDDIERLREHLHLEQWSVMGHSFGGMVASYYATQFPERIQKMILSSSGGIDLDLLTYVRNAIDNQLGSDGLDSMQYWTRKIEQGDTSQYARLQRGKFLAPAYVENKAHYSAIAVRLSQSNSQINQLMWNNMHKIHFNCSEKLKSFDKPVLIIQGDHDIIQPQTAEKAHGILKKSRIVYLEHCKHFGWLDNPDVFYKEVTSFLAEA